MPWRAAMPRLPNDPDKRYQRLAGRQLTFGFARRCAHPQRRLKWRLLATGGAHLGAFCRQCVKWITWLPQDPDTLAEAPPRPGRP